MEVESLIRKKINKSERQNKMNKIARAIYQANKDKSSIKANIRLKKNGRFSSVSGTVEALKVSRDGVPYMTVKRPDQEFQSVRLHNVISINKNGRTYK